MPKVTLRPIDKFDRQLKVNIKQLRCDDSYEQFGEKVGMTGSTARRRVLNPLDLTLRELFNICQKFRISVSRFVSEDLIG